MDRLKKFFVNGILMTMVALAVRYVSVGFNVYISNKIGAVAMGIFTLIGSVYGFALTLATSGISLATTKLVSEALGYGVDQNYPTDATISSVMKKSLLLIEQALCVFKGYHVK
jgi:O-antigen/teichoic acid export membrane protein